MLGEFSRSANRIVNFIPKTRTVEKFLFGGAKERCGKEKARLRRGRANGEGLVPKKVGDDTLYLCYSSLSRIQSNFLRITMINSEILQGCEDEALFLYSPNANTEESIQVLEPSPWQGLETLCRGDSMNYISQFLSLIEEELPSDPKLLSKDTTPPKTDAFAFTSGRNEGGDPIQKQKKIRKVTNSPFHNYQKHLNNALKKMITLPELRHSDPLFLKAAHRLWAKYLKSDIKTKKILHSVFNERHETRPNEAQLRNYDFWDIYVEFGEANFRETKAYLSRLAVEQITSKNIDEYLLTRKLIKREGFKEYLLEFRQQLLNGFLKRRIILEHTES